jgi:hypothetical protein
MRATASQPAYKLMALFRTGLRMRFGSYLVHTRISSLGLVGLLRPRGKVEMIPLCEPDRERSPRTMVGVYTV